MTMDPFLAHMYKTAETIGATQSSEDVQKLAAAQFTDGLQSIRETLGAEGFDIDQLSPETVMKVASLMGLNKAAEEPCSSEEKKDKEPPPFPPKKEEEKKEDEAEKKAAAEAEMREKMAEFDFLGRVVAHAYVDELGKIEKAASGEVREPEKTAGRLVPAADVQQANVFDAMAVERAREMLKEAGYEVPEAQTPEQPAQEPEKVASQEEQFQAAINARALEMLKEAGYPVE